MNTGQLKLVSWTLASVFGLGLAGYVGNYLLHRGTLEARVGGKEIQDVLSKVTPVEKKAEDIVSYDLVNAALYKFNWTGKAPPKPVEEVKPVAKVTPGTEPVSTLVQVLLIKEDPIDDSGSRAVIKYLPAAKVTMKDPAIVKHVGDTLDGSLDFISIGDITAAGVVFKFRDGKRADETVGVNELSRRLDMDTIAGTKGVLPATPEVRYPKGPRYGEAPDRTVRLSDTSFQIGTADMDDWNDNYQDYLTEVEHRQHRDPSTGKYDGIVLDKVPPGSVAAAHGAKDGDIIKSINGHPVNSTQEAISFVKNNKDKYDVWEVEVENKGKIRIVTYKVPKKK
ncbi:MAG: hypothetical protein IPK67_06305 [Planctomycetes bacterium]|nr:hypothetical protein [Planctomycetota bacterium]